jgi:hypothetical protein
LAIGRLAAREGLGVLKGSCLCGKIRYEVSGPLGPVVYCHCSQCRKASGSSFATNASIAVDHFRITRGAGLLRDYESSQGVKRCFCAECGSAIIKRVESSPDSVRLRLGTLDGDPGVKPVAHIFVGSRAPWTALTDGLPRHE